MLVSLLLFLGVSAHAATACPWAGAASVSAHASMTRVWVNGQEFSVRGREAGRVFEEDLRACGADEAVADFQRWRAHRRGVNVGGVLLGVGAFIPFAGWGMMAGAAIGMPIGGSIAHARREDLVADLERSAGTTAQRD